MTGQPDEPAPARWSAASQYADMWLDPADDPRDTGTELTDERSTLVEYLRAYRLTLELKCADLDAEQLARRSVPPSTMSLLGLVRHMAEVERHWFRRVMAGEDAPKRYCTEEVPDGDWDGAVPEPTVVTEAWEAWRAAVAFADDLVGRTTDLGRRFVECFVGAMDDAGLPADPEFRAAMRAYMEWAVAAVLVWSPEGSVVPAGAPMPRWSWDGLAH